MERLLKAARCAPVAALLLACLAVRANAQEKDAAAQGAPQRRIRELLANCPQLLAEARYDDLREAAEKALELDPANDKAGLFLWIARDLAAPPPWMAELKKKLETKVSFDFVETPLRNIVTFLQEITDATIILDEGAVEEVPNSQVTLKVTDMRLASALKWIVDQAGLEYALRDRAIFISSKERIAGPPRRNDVVAVELEARGLETDAGMLLSGYRFRPCPRRKFYIFCSDGDGRMIKLSWREDAPVLVDEGSLSDEERKNIFGGRPPLWLSDITEKLGMKVTFDFVETPLRDIVSFLQQMTDANIILDRNALKEVPNPEVTLKVTDMKLGEALDWMLGAANLGYAYADGAIYISSEYSVSNKAALKLNYATDVVVEVRQGGAAPKTFSGQPFLYVDGGRFSISCSDDSGRHFELGGVCRWGRPNVGKRAP